MAVDNWVKLSKQEVDRAKAVLEREKEKRKGKKFKLIKVDSKTYIEKELEPYERAESKIKY